MMLGLLAGRRVYKNSVFVNAIVRRLGEPEDSSMAISFKRVSGSELPIYFRAEGLAFAYRITSYDGHVTFVRSEGEAVALTASLHREDRRLSDGAIP